MTTLLIILLGTVLIQGSAVAVGASPVKQGARGIWTDELRTAGFTLVTLTVAALYGFAMTHYVLEPYRLAYLRTPLLLLGVAIIFLGARRWFDRVPGAIRWPDLMAHLTTQVALLGVALFTATYCASMLEAFAYGVGAASALAALSSAFAALLARVDTVAVPFVFRGIPVALITAGLTALALMGFAGLINR